MLKTKYLVKALKLNPQSVDKKSPAPPESSACAKVIHKSSRYDVDNGRIQRREYSAVSTAP
jgi:hypothetical protein